MKEQKEKRLIKRYRNRKLYDLADSTYVTLEDIADLIRSGEDVQIMDDRSGEDITSVTLAQIILDDERRRKAVLPLGTLLQLVRSGGEQIRDFVQKSIGEGAKEIGQARDGIYDNFGKWVSRGVISPEEGTKFISGIKSFIETKVRATIESVQNIPSVQTEVKNLKEKIARLEKEIQKQNKKKAGS